MRAEKLDGILLLEVRADRPLRKLSPYIYGTNDVREIVKNRQGLLRSGGNRLTAYNWETNASNAGSDWQFQNDEFLSKSNEPAAAILPLIREAEKMRAAALVTVPIVDYVAADKRGGGDVRQSGADYLQTRFLRNRPAKGAPFASTPDPSDRFVHQDEFVAFLQQALPRAKLLFSLDNEPDLWASTHAAIHPAKVTYAELVQRNVDYAKAIKGVTDAEVLGFVSYGWHGFQTLQDAPDAAQHGPFLDHYLTEMKKAEAAAGKRLIDYLDLHWYPEAQGEGERIVFGKKHGRALDEARLQAPRSLWDPDYREHSWIATKLGQPIQLLPRVREKIERHYPGTKLAISEWSYGGGGDIGGALAAADVLGIFGCQGVSLAANWATGGAEPFVMAAFRAFRSFDGAGAAFGDVALWSRTSNYESSSVYASADSNGAPRVVVVAINKSTRDEDAVLRIDAPAQLMRAEVYQLSAAEPELLKAEPLAAAKQNAFRFTLKARSLVVIAANP